MSLESLEEQLGLSLGKKGGKWENKEGRKSLGGMIGKVFWQPYNLGVANANRWEWKGRWGQRVKSQGGCGKAFEFYPSE